MPANANANESAPTLSILYGRSYGKAAPGQQPEAHPGWMATNLVCSRLFSECVIEDRPRRPLSLVEAVTAPNPLDQGLDTLPGVSPARLELLRRLGLETVGDLLFHFPRAYEDLTDVRRIADLTEGDLQTV